MFFLCVIPKMSNLTPSLCCFWESVLAILKEFPLTFLSTFGLLSSPQCHSAPAPVWSGLPGSDWTPKTGFLAHCSAFLCYCQLHCKCYLFQMIKPRCLHSVRDHIPKEIKDTLLQYVLCHLKSLFLYLIFCIKASHGQNNMKTNSEAFS